MEWMRLGVLEAMHRVLFDYVSEPTVLGDQCFKMLGCMKVGKRIYVEYTWDE